MEQKEKLEQDNGVGNMGLGGQVEAFLRLITIMWDGAKEGGQVCAINS